MHHFQSKLPDETLEIWLVALLMAGESGASSECLSASWVLAHIGPLSSVCSPMTGE